MDKIICASCNEEKSWQRFRVRRGDGTFKESTFCSVCRNKLAAAAIRQKKKSAKQVVLNRTHQQARLKAGYPHYHPDIEQDMKVYCNKKTAMDRKYLRDNEHLPLSYRPHIAHKQQTARDHAKGWIGFYEEICNHAINLLRTTGTRPPWAQLEGSADLQLLYGVYRTRRAQQLRERG